MKWTKSSVKQFAKMIKQASVQELKEYIEKNGDGHIPPESWEWHDHYTNSIVFHNCVANPVGAIPKLEFFIDEGLEECWWDTGSLLRPISGSSEPPTFQAEELAAVKDIFRLMRDKGWRVKSSYDWDLVLLIYAFYDDVDFLKFLTEIGVNYREVKSSYKMKDVTSFLLKNSSYDVLDFLVSHGMELNRSRVGCICNEWSKEMVGYLVSRKASILLEDFADDCDLDVYRFAVESAGMKSENERYLWDKVINRRRLDIGEYLLSKGVKKPSDSVVIEVDDRELIDWALKNGFDLSVDIKGCGRDTLLYAAKKGIRPVGKLKIDPAKHEIAGFWQNGSEYEGMQAICELFDIELIKAFLDAGFTKGIDPSNACAAGNKELIALYEQYGIKTALTRVVDGSPLVKNGVAVIPEGVLEVAHDAFAGVAFKSVTLPSTLRKIGERAFAGWNKTGKPLEITVPKSVGSLGYGAFAGFKKIRVYDNLDAKAAPANRKIDPINGEPNGSIGWVGVSPYRHYSICAANASRYDHEVTVLSVETDEVKYRVEMPIGSAKREVYCTLVSAWGRNAEFDFSVYKTIFDKLPGKISKVKTALNRLLWPINLNEADRARYEGYVVKNAKDAVSILLSDDGMRGIEMLASLGAIKKANVDAMIALASDARRADAVAFFQSYKAEHLSVKKSSAAKAQGSSTSDGSKSSSSKKAKGPSAASVLKQLSEGIPNGDCSALKQLDTAAAVKVKPEVAVSYLETAAVVCSFEDIDMMFAVFGDFEYKTGALVSAIKKGKIDNAEALVRNGAHLDNSILHSKGDTVGKLQRRIDNSYVLSAESLSLSKSKDERAVEELIKRNCLSANDLKVLLLLAVRDGNDKLTRILRDLGALQGGGIICLREGHKNAESRMAHDLTAFLTPSVSAGVAKAVCTADPQVINRCWSDKMASKGRLLQELVPYLREETASSSASEMVLTLAREGDIDSLKIVLSWPSALKERILGKAIEAAFDARKTEAVAYLMDLKGKVFAADCSLSLDDEGSEGNGETVCIPKFEQSKYADVYFEFTCVPDFSIEGKLFVFTGLDETDKAKATSIVEAAGGIVKSSVVLATDYLVVDESYSRQTTKYDRAIELNARGKNIGIISLGDFFKYSKML